MIKGSGINFFYNQLELNTGSFAVFYTFEEGAGTVIQSISGAQAQYSGTLNYDTNFWIKPGSGFFSGNSLTINNASGLYSNNWTKIFVFEKVNSNNAILFNSYVGNSGYKIGLTDTNKIFFESFNNEPVVASSNNNYSSKNAIAISYFTNVLSINYYNFNSKEVESEEFTYPFEVNRSDNWAIGGAFTGYLDYFIYLSAYQSPSVISQLLSGLFAVPTGQSYSIQEITTTGITGYQNVFIGQTGVTGYVIIPTGDEGINYYTGQFPTSNNVIYLTGYLSSGLYSSGVGGNSSYYVTGDSIEYQYYLNTGYANSFGMEKVQLLNYIENSDIVKIGWSTTPFKDIYNKSTIPNYSGFYLEAPLHSGILNLYQNGLALSNLNWLLDSQYIFINESQINDIVFYDMLSGARGRYHRTGSLIIFPINYSGQDIFLNGLNLISGNDFITSGNNLVLINENTGVSGYIFEYPTRLLNYETGNFDVKNNLKFNRKTSNIYINGLRQKNNYSYVEGAIFDRLSGNFFDENAVFSIYDNNNLFWEN